MEYQLERWSLQPVYGGSEYAEPQRGLRGYRNGEAMPVRTSRIVAVAGNKVTTASGSTYILGEPDPQYIKWCLAHGCHVPTPEEPIKLKGKIT